MPGAPPAQASGRTTYGAWWTQTRGLIRPAGDCLRVRGQRPLSGGTGRRDRIAVQHIPAERRPSRPTARLPLCLPGRKSRTSSGDSHARYHGSLRRGGVKSVPGFKERFEGRHWILTNKAISILGRNEALSPSGGFREQRVKPLNEAWHAVLTCQNENSGVATSSKPVCQPPASPETKPWPTASSQVLEGRGLFCREIGERPWAVPCTPPFPSPPPALPVGVWILTPARRGLCGGCGL